MKKSNRTKRMKGALHETRLGEANRDLLKIVELVLYFINKGKISAHNFKKLKYLIYFANFDHYEKHCRPIIKVHFYRNKDDFEIRLK